MGAPRESWAAASSERWLSDAALAWRVVAARAKELAVPSLAVGFSLGALVLVDLSHSDNSVRPDAFVLLAPATVLRPRVYLLHPLTALGIAIASAAPRAYRSASVLPAKAYRAFFDLVDRAAGQPLPRFRPSLVFVDSEDFLVDAGALTAAAARERECRLVTIHSRGYVAGARHHLILDIDSMGAEAWHTMTEELRSFVDGVAASGPRAQSP